MESISKKQPQLHMNDIRLRGTPYDKDPEPHDLGWGFVAIAALLLGVLPSLIVGLVQ